MGKARPLRRTGKVALARCQPRNMYNGKPDVLRRYWQCSSHAACCSDYDAFDAFTLEQLGGGLLLGVSGDGECYLLLLGFVDLEDPDTVCGDLVDG